MTRSDEEGGGGRRKHQHQIGDPLDPVLTGPNAPSLTGNDPKSLVQLCWSGLLVFIPTDMTAVLSSSDLIYWDCSESRCGLSTGC